MCTYDWLTAVVELITYYHTMTNSAHFLFCFALLLYRNKPRDFAGGVRTPCYYSSKHICGGIKLFFLVLSLSFVLLSLNRLFIYLFSFLSWRHGELHTIHKHRKSERKKEKNDVIEKFTDSFFVIKLNVFLSCFVLSLLRGKERTVSNHCSWKNPLRSAVC